jgi:hypothetical protein
MARPRSLDRSIEIKVFADVAALNAAMGNVNKSLGGISGAAFRLNNLTSMLSSAVSAVQDIVRPLVDAAFAASNLDQAIGKSRAVFGDYSRTIEDWSQRTATAYGVSRQAAIDASGSMGNVFTSLGVSEEAASKFGATAVKVAADMGAFANLPIEEALVALRSGLVGETEPLRRFGIVVYDAAVKTKALELGLWDGTGAMDEGAKVLARWALIQERATNMTGSFNREIDTLQVQLQKFNAEWANTQALAGRGLVDPLAELVKAARGANIALQGQSGNEGLNSAITGFAIAMNTSLFGVPKLLADTVRGLSGMADSADQAAIDFQHQADKWDAVSRYYQGATVSYSQLAGDVLRDNQAISASMQRVRGYLVTPWSAGIAEHKAYLAEMATTTSALEALIKGLGAPTLREQIKVAGDLIRKGLIGEMLRSDDPEKVARAQVFIDQLARDMVKLGVPAFRKTGDTMIDSLIRQAFDSAVRTAAIDRFLTRYQAYLNRNPLQVKLDPGDWYESLGGTRPSGTGGRSAPGGATQNIYVTASNPDAVVAAITRYSRTNGSTAGFARTISR